MLEAAIAVGTTEGVGALTIQGIATASGVSKALVLYHYNDKEALLGVLAARLAERDIALLRGAAADPDVLEGWRRSAVETV